MSSETSINTETWPAPMRAVFLAAEQSFLAAKAKTEQDFREKLAQLRAELPSSGYGELDRATQAFDAEMKDAVRAFYAEFRLAEALEGELIRNARRDGDYLTASNT